MIADLWVAAWKTAMPAIDFDARRAWLVERIGQWPLLLRLTDVGGKLLGFALLNPERHYLDQFAIAPAAVGTGAARILLDAVKQRCNDCVRLDVNADNPRAVRFYQREGFAVTGYGVNHASGLRTIAMLWTAAA